MYIIMPLKRKHTVSRRKRGKSQSGGYVYAKTKLRSNKSKTSKKQSKSGTK
jgi:hypothetical protein